MATLALLLISAGGNLNAAETAEDPLTLSRALSIALIKNPTLQAYAFETRVAEARILQAGIRPNPELSLEFENFLGTGQLSGVKALETTLQLSQVIDLGRSISRQVAAAQGARALTDVEYEIKRLDVLAEVARRFTATVADTERLKIARQARELGEQTVATVQTRVDAAVVSNIELHKARTALFLLQIEAEHVEHELASCRQSLAAILGEHTPLFGQSQGDLLVLPDVPDFESLAARLENSPALNRFAVEVRWHEAQIRLAQSLRRSGTRWSAGLRRVEATDDIGFTAAISMPLAIRNQSQGTVREARARREQLGASAEAMRLELRATLFAIYQEMLHASMVVKLLQQEVIPDAQETLTLTRQGYREGRFSLLDLLNAQQSLVDLRAKAVDSAASYHLHIVEIERLLGAPLQDFSPHS
ncbi:MAG: TolC family protein [Cephaloticoccus sp.]|nr:TolC family protein [Cephaloticoccus sp.]